MNTVIAICIGASGGAVTRWFLGTKLNHIYPNLPLGTLAVNLLGGYLIGFFIAFFAQNSSLSPEWRMLVITGFLGGLTTFSTFSAEMVTLLQQNNYAALGIGLLTHVGGSILMTILGMASFKFLF